jgi:hypothetical protein
MAKISALDYIRANDFCVVCFMVAGVSRPCRLPAGPPMALPFDLSAVCGVASERGFLADNLDVVDVRDWVGQPVLQCWIYRDEEEWNDLAGRETALRV